VMPSPLAVFALTINLSLLGTRRADMGRVLPINFESLAGGS
jgi:hypothetical protein